MRYEIRPLGTWTDPVTTNRASSGRFRASWPDTLKLLERETDMLGASLVVMQIDVTEGDLRRDGMLRAQAKVNFPGVRISFDSKHGPLTYATDAYGTWQENCSAVAMTLRALREVESASGIGCGREQYIGFAATATAIPLRDRRGRVVAEAVVDAADDYLTRRRWYRLANGYVVRTEIRAGKKVMVYLHREILGLGSYAEHPVQVDHEDGNRLNNCRSNLRLARPGQNAQNRGANRGRRLPRGVCLRPETGKYRAFAKLGGRVHELGAYDSPERASAAVEAWRAQHMPFSADARRVLSL